LLQDEKDIAEVVSKWIDIPVSRLMEGEKEPHLTSSPPYKEECFNIGHCIQILIVTAFRGDHKRI